LLTTYSGIYDHCGAFALDTFPRIVTLANAVVNYAKDTATYYPEMDRLFEVLLNYSNSDAVRAAAAADLRGISSGLENRTKARGAEVQNMSREIHVVSFLCICDSGMT
jgi:hypothetical protein